MLNKQFFLGFIIGLCLILLISGTSAHLSPDCGLPTVFRLDSYADDISRTSFPLVFYENGGIVYRHVFILSNLILDMDFGSLLAGGFGWWFAHHTSQESTLER